MQRVLDNIQEVGFKADNGSFIRVTSFAEVAISAIRKYERDEGGNKRGAGYRVTMIFTAPRTNETLAIYETEYTSLDELLEKLGIEDYEDVWEVLE